MPELPEVETTKRGVEPFLKNKIIKVIIIVLMVKFFEKVLKLSQNFTTPTDILYFGLSILSICLGFYLINKNKD